MEVFKPMKRIPFWVFFISFFIFITPLFGDDDSKKTPPWNVDDPSPPPFIQERANFSPFKPSIAAIIGVLTTIFCITFLFLLYAKHCKRENDVVYSNDTGLTLSTARKNSGIDRTVIESLPIFRFGALRGQKDRLECAICLTRFEPTEILRLLPKCKHAFHVECVDTWLDSHSTCPLCRYRVDPEDILLVEDVKILHENQETESEPQVNQGFRRVSGRHSSAGELERGSCSCSRDPTSYRRSLDSARLLKKKESVTIGCFDRHRKDGLLLTDGVLSDKKSFERRFGHRIIISATGWSGSEFHQRWSDVFPSDLLYLRSEMIISDSHKFSSGASRPSATQQMPVQVQDSRIAIDGGRTNGSSVINSRSVSEITGLSRFSNSESDSIVNRNHRQQQQRQRQVGLVSRWMAWISSQSLPAVRSDCSTDFINIV